MRGVSRTAIAVGMLRALHRAVDREPWVIEDRVSVALFGDAVRKHLENEPAWAQDERRTELRGHVLVRSRFAENRLRSAVARGVRQCVVLGAGFDTFAYRQPGWMNEVRVYEVDAPETQAEKLERLARARISIPGNVVYAPIDFERTSLASGLRIAGFDAASPAFFSWLGVMVYLTSKAMEAVFRYVATLRAGSEIAFTFTQPSDDETVARRVAELGEPMRTRVSASEPEAMLRGIGFRSITRLTTGEASSFLGERRDALKLPARESIAAAIV